MALKLGVDRRTFLMAAGAAALSPRRTRAQSSLGTLTWVEEGGLWFRELPDGPAMKIATAAGWHSPRFSPSGQWIGIQDRDDKQLVVDRDGRSGSVERLSPRDRALLNAENVFAPDGQRYVFSREIPGKEEDSRVGQLCLASLAAPDREPRVLVSDEKGGKQAYAWSRDGKSIVYWDGNDWGASPWADGMPLKSVNVASGMIRDLHVTALDHEDLLDLAPESAGNKLAVTGGDGRETWADKHVSIVDLDTGVSRRAMPDDIASVCPAWPPDGSHIACSAGPDANIAYNRANAGLSYRAVLPNGKVETRTIKPDSNINIAGGEEAHVYLQQRKIWLLDATGRDAPRRLTNDSRYRDEEPLWSRDGGHILFGRMDYDGHKSLWLMDSNGANAAQVCRLQIAEPLEHGDSWFGYYGYTDWRRGFDWRR
ncbi:MAG TPA: hypothetical protein VH639_07665 [Bryobacteraceae bacterium]|jgi:Tol biopolymer transport system component